MSVENLIPALAQAETRALTGSDVTALCDDYGVLLMYTAAHLLTMTLDARRARLATLADELSANAVTDLKATLTTLHKSRPHYGESPTGERT